MTNIYKSVGASFCKITSSLGGKYSAFISVTFKFPKKKKQTNKKTNKHEAAIAICVLMRIRIKVRFVLPVGKVSRLTLHGTSTLDQPVNRIESVKCLIELLLEVIQLSLAAAALLNQFCASSTNEQASDLVA